MVVWSDVRPRCFGVSSAVLVSDLFCDGMFVDEMCSEVTTGRELWVLESLAFLQGSKENEA